MSNYFKLAPGQGVFWDPTQPKVENQKLAGNQIKELELTSSVNEAKRNERILPATEEEYIKANGIEQKPQTNEPKEKGDPKTTPAGTKTTPAGTKATTEGGETKK